MRNILSIPINKKRLLLFLFLLTSSPAFANCPTGFQEKATYYTREFKIRWEHEGEYSKCLSINNPKDNTIRKSYGLGSYNYNYKCGKIHLAEFSSGNPGRLYVQPSDSSLKPILFQGPYREVRNGKIDGVTDREWCEEAGEYMYCYEEQVWSDTYAPVQILMQNDFIYSQDTRRTVKECKIVRF